MEEKKDIGGMIEATGAAFPYMATVGQLPALHPWLRGNKKLMKLLKYLRPNQPHPFLDILKVGPDTFLGICRFFPSRTNITLDHRRRGRPI